jgi:hypothetical protein
MSSLLVFNSVYRLAIQSVLLVFSTPLVNDCPSTISLTFLTPLPPPPKKNIRTVFADCVWVWGGGGGVLSCVVDHILQEFNTQLLSRLRAYKIATPPLAKNTGKDDIKVLVSL